MSSKQVLGKDVVVYIDVDSVLTPYGCGLNVSLTVSTEFVETTVSGSGIWKTVLPTKNSWGGTLGGIVSINDGNLTLADLRGLQYAQTRLFIQFKRTSEDGLEISDDEGYCYIANSSDSGSYNDMDNFSIEVIGDGELIQSGS